MARFGSQVGVRKEVATCHIQLVAIHGQCSHTRVAGGLVMCMCFVFCMNIWVWWNCDGRQSVLWCCICFQSLYFCVESKCWYQRARVLRKGVTRINQWQERVPPLLQYKMWRPSRKTGRPSLCQLKPRIRYTNQIWPTRLYAWWVINWQ